MDSGFGAVAMGANSNCQSRKRLYLTNSGCLIHLQGKLERLRTSVEAKLAGTVPAMHRARP